MKHHSLLPLSRGAADRSVYYRESESSLALQIQPRYAWAALARVTFGWHSTTPEAYYLQISAGGVP
jgi:hypothetical protein